jgi:TolB-like protein/DNA-binding winged helix-turn-helix (wHTH) protein/Tfp pilus assembly protein PilF
MLDHHTVRFGTFEFDLASGDLRSNGRRVPLQGQPAQVLAQLVGASGRLVTRDELRRAIWPEDTFVEFDTALNVAINKVRQALRDSASAPRFIETVPKRGYRFLADVRPVVPADPPADPAGVPPLPVPAAAPVAPRALAQSRWVWLAAAVILTVTVGAVWSGNRSASSTPPGIRSLAVLPFHPLVAGEGDDALEVGLAEAIIVRLGQLKQLRLPSIHAVQRYAERQPDSRLAGRDLGVESVLEGSLQRVNGSVRLSARLIDVASGETLWAEQWDFPWTDIFTVQDAMAGEVSRALALNLAAADRRPLQAHPTNVAAYDAYLRARYLLLRRTVSDSRRAGELLEEAIKLDPASAAAHASLAFAYISIPLLDGPTTPFVERARAAARRALDLDPTIGEAHAVLGRVLLHFDWDVEAADREMRRALALNPTDPFVLHCYSQVLAQEGRFEEALMLAERARAQDPASVLANRDKAIVLFLARRYDECVDQCQRTLELDPHAPFVQFYLGRAYEQLGRDREAIEAYIAPFALSDRYRDWLPKFRTAAAQGDLKAFGKLRLQFLLAQPEVSTYSVATAYVQLGDHDRALEWLEKLYQARGGRIRLLRASPEWDPLRSDPRFQDLLRRANIAPIEIPGLQK